MFSKLKTYAVYVRKDAAEPLDSAIFIAEGFSLWAFLFTLFWAVYHGLWRVAAAVLALYALAGVLVMEGLMPSMGADITNLAIGLWLALDAADLRGERLRRKGYILYDVVRGVDEEDATIRFIYGAAA